MRMYDMHRGLMTALSAGIAGGLIWLASAYVGRGSEGRFWATMGIIAGAGLVMALGQLLGGWTKWGWPRLSLGVLLLGFLPVLIVVGWVLLATQPLGGWQQGHISSWSTSVGIFDVVRNLGVYAPVLAFGFGLVFGYSFDTTGPRRREDVVVHHDHATHVAPVAVPVMDRAAADEPTLAERSTVGAAEPTRVHDDTLVGTKHNGRVEGRRDVEIREGGERVVPQPDPERTPEQLD